MAEFQLILNLRYRILKDEESVPAHLRDTEDYKELMELKRIKRQKIVEYQVLHAVFSIVHFIGFSVVSPRCISTVTFNYTCCIYDQNLVLYEEMLIWWGGVISMKESSFFNVSRIFLSTKFSDKVLRNSWIFESTRYFFFRVLMFVVSPTKQSLNPCERSYNWLSDFGFLTQNKLLILRGPCVTIKFFSVRKINRLTTERIAVVNFNFDLLGKHEEFVLFIYLFIYSKRRKESFITDLW